MGLPPATTPMGRNYLGIVSFRNLSRLQGGNAHPLSAIQMPLPSFLLPQTLLPLRGPRTETEGTARTALWVAALSLKLLLATGLEVLGRKEGRRKQEKTICLWVRAKDHRIKEAKPREKPRNVLLLGLSEASCWFIQTLPLENRSYSHRKGHMLSVARGCKMQHLWQC